MRGTISIGALIVVLAASAAANAQNQSQPQPQLTPQQKAEQPLDHEKERAKQQAGEKTPGGGEQDPNKGRGRTPETGQAMGMPPSTPDSADANVLASLPGVSPETVPAKFSEKISKQDEIKTTERSLMLTDDQKRILLQRLGEAKDAKNVTSQGLYAETGTLIPNDITAQEIPQELQANMPGLKGLKYVKKDKQLLLVMPANGIVRSVLQ